MKVKLYITLFLVLVLCFSLLSSCTVSVSEDGDAEIDDEMNDADVNGDQSGNINTDSDGNIIVDSESASQVGSSESVSDSEQNSGENTEGESEMESEKNTEQVTTPPDKLTESILTKKIDIDALLSRPFNSTVPTAFSEGFFALHTEGWGFDNGTVLTTGNANGLGMPVEISINSKVVSAQNKTWMPSHVTSVFDSSKYGVNVASEATVSASYTSQYDSNGIAHLTDGTISYTDSPRNRWSNYVSPARTGKETITFDFNQSKIFLSLIVHFYDDGGNTRLPSALSVEYYNGSQWKAVSGLKYDKIVTSSGVTVSFDAVTATKIRLVLTPTSGKAMGITELKVMAQDTSSGAIPVGVIIEENKFITQNDIVASVISLKNNSNKSVTVKIKATPSMGKTEEKFGYRYALFGGNTENTVTLAAGKSAEVKVCIAVSDKSGESATKISKFLADTSSVINHTRAFNKWFENNVPYFDCDDEQLVQIYYFRWLTYRNNIRKITDEWNGYIISEFLPNVNWSGIYNSISCPAGHHFYEGRWIRNEKYLDSYQEFWFIDGAEPRRYSFPIADAYYNRYLVTGDKTELVKYLDELDSNYAAWEKNKYVSSLGLFKQIADRDGMENGIGGDGVRPTINSYMYGDAVAITKIATMANNTTLASKYSSKANTLRANVMNKLWNPQEQFFETVSESGNSVNIRELIGYVPWYFNLPTDSATYSVAFNQLLDDQGFKATYGPTTAEQRDPNFMSKLRPECRWDGPSWPFATSQTITAAANLLNNYKQNNSFDKGDWFDLLMTYTKSQYKWGAPWVAEDLHPYTGEWIVDYDRSIHYNHSSYTDLVITGLVGLRPEDNDKTVTINPLLESGDLDYFMMENVLYRGHDITVVYDKDGTQYNLGKGLSVFVDGELKASSTTLNKLVVDLK